MYARGTSRWTFGGSGKVMRSKENGQLATFQSLKTKGLAPSVQCGLECRIQHRCARAGGLAEDGCTEAGCKAKACGNRPTFRTRIENADRARRHLGTSLDSGCGTLTASRVFRSALVADPDTLTTAPTGA
jgi:hypothetical protein